jgi:hypothetical protein
MASPFFRSAILSSSTVLLFAIGQPSLSHHGDKHAGPNQIAHISPMAHSHGTLEIPTGQPLPTLKLNLYPDAKKGWNLELKTTQFTFAPQRINEGNNPQEGHAHLMINGESITRLYGNWYYLNTLKPGRNTISVSLASNSHSKLVFQGKPIADTIVITVPKS